MNLKADELLVLLAKAALGSAIGLFIVGLLLTQSITSALLGSLAITAGLVALVAVLYFPLRFLSQRFGMLRAILFMFPVALVGLFLFAVLWNR